MVKDALLMGGGRYTKTAIAPIRVQEGDPQGHTAPAEPGLVPVGFVLMPMAYIVWLIGAFGDEFGREQGDPGVDQILNQSENAGIGSKVLRALGIGAETVDIIALLFSLSDLGVLQSFLEALLQFRIEFIEFLPEENVVDDQVAVFMKEGQLLAGELAGFGFGLLHLLGI